MKPIRNERTNRVFKLQGGTSENDLPVEQKHHGEDGFSQTSYWLPTESELIQLEDGATIALSVWGSGHPPVNLRTGPALDTPTPAQMAEARRLLHHALAAEKSAVASGEGPGAFSEGFRVELAAFLEQTGGAVGPRGQEEAEPVAAAPGQPAYPAELLDQLAVSMARLIVGEGMGTAGHRETALGVLDRYSAEVGRENVPAVVDQAIATAERP